MGRHGVAMVSAVPEALMIGTISDERNQKMMTAADAVKAAKTVLPGSPEHGTACELCRLRGYDPSAMITTVAGLPPVSNWQWLVAEKILEEHLRHALGRGAKAQRLMANG